MKLVAWLLQALCGLCAFLPYSVSAKPLGICSALSTVVEAELRLTGDGATADKLKAMREEIEKDALVASAKRATKA